MAVHVVQTPVRAECLNRIIPPGERYLRRAIAEYVARYHGERNDQGLENELIMRGAPLHTSGAVRREQRLGGMLGCYRRAA